MKVLILGCGGFIGSHLIGRMIEDGGYEISGADLSEYKIYEHLGYFQFEKRDVFGDPQWLDRKVADADTVIFLATICNPALYVRDPVETIRSNFQRPTRVVDACARHGKRLIVYSTCEVYGRTISSYVGDRYEEESLFLQNEDSTPSVLGPMQATRWSYASAKQLLDRYIYGMHLQENLAFTIIRPYNFFGARMDYIPDQWNPGVPRVLACFMEALMRNQPIKLVDGGVSRRSITYIDDAIEATIRILSRPDRANGQVFNIGNPENELSVRELAMKLRDIYADVTGDDSFRSHPIEDVSSEDFYGKGYEDSDRRVPDIGKAQRLLGWQPRYGLDETLRMAVEFFMEFESNRERAVRATV
jgi:UDP-apiose/xylose synthase